ncbi:hypothetical protein DMUE_1744 [Dictyocoela muelleri]|nr:hypothetical protein DMUE_1744 [Dictyocoela muelleri]
MNYTPKILRKNPISRNSFANKILRFEYSINLNMIANENIFLLDESGFNLHASPKYGYSPKNTKAYTTVQNSKGSNVPFIRTISENGIYSYRTKLGTFKSGDLINYINSELQSLSGNNIKHIIMDNASIHKTRHVQQSFAQRQYILKFFPPYSPHLNHIEEFFSAFKSKFIRRDQ